MRGSESSLVLSSHYFLLIGPSPLLRFSKLASFLLCALSLTVWSNPVCAQQVRPGVVDLGSLPDSAPVQRLQLVLTRSAAQEAQLEALLAAQQDAHDSRYHQWLSPADFGARFGVSPAAADGVVAWLAGHGFTEIHLSTGRTLVEFSGTAGSLRRAFGADFHTFSTSDSATWSALSGSTTIPTELFPLVKGFAGLGVAPRVAQASTELRRDNLTGNVTLRPQGGIRPAYTLGSNNTTYYAITPYDFATIYDVLPLWNAATPIDGTGQTIAVAGDTDINPADFVSFRTLFGLPLGNTNTPTGTQYLNIIYNGPKPALRTDEFHAASDTQWAGAAAKGATIDYVTSQSTEASSGLDLSAAYIVNNNLASILVYSYSQCELQLGTAGNAFYKSLWQQAAAQGIAVVTATGDSGAAACDGAHVGPAMRGTTVNGIGSTPYDVSVGATEFYLPNGAAPYFSREQQQHIRLRNRLYSGAGLERFLHESSYPGHLALRRPDRRAGLQYQRRKIRQSRHDFRRWRGRIFLRLVGRK